MAETRVGAGRKHVFMCGTPNECCTGSTIQVNQGLRTKVNKAHPSPEQAFKCHKKWLISQGFVEVGQRELLAPDGSGVRVLSKKSHFGAELRDGKASSRYQPNSKYRGVII